MVRIKSRVRIGCACLALLTVGGSTAWSQQKEAAKDPGAVQEESKESAWLHRIFFREISAYEFYLDAEKQHKLVMRREPALRYPAPSEYWGEIYVWTDRGRAAVVGCVFGLNRGGGRRINHEFHSLCEKPLVAVGGATGWQPEEPGIAFKAISDAPEPAKDRAGRLVQMRDIARRFTAGMISGDAEMGLPLSPQPIFRYELTDKDSPVVDGALFTYAPAAVRDPEVLLVLEAKRTDQGVRWHYAPVRFTNRGAWVKYQGKEVWRVDAATVGIFDNVTWKPYGVFFVKMIPNDVDDK
jgi:hypothetical protein